MALLAGAVSGYSQGQVQMYDYGLSFAIQVFQPSTPATVAVSWGGNTTMEEQGNTAANDNPGTATYTGAPLGAGYTVELLAGPAGSALSALSEVAGSTVTTWAPNGAAGYWNTSALATIPGITTTAQVAIAAWDNEGGTVTSLAAAQTAGDPWGISATGTTAALGYGTVLPPTLPAGVTSFSLGSIPEPSTIALGVIGASAFLMRLRRKQ